MFLVCGPSSNMRYLSPLSWWSPTMLDVHQGTSTLTYIRLWLYPIKLPCKQIKYEMSYIYRILYNYIIKLSWNHEIHGYIPCPYCFSTLTMSPFFHAVSSRTPLIPIGWVKWKWQVLCEASDGAAWVINVLFLAKSGRISSITNLIIATIIWWLLVECYGIW